jgi:Cu(I)/Ag(I) efflux system membrane fusion protein
MRKNSIVKILALLLLVSVSFLSCKDKAGKQAVHAGHQKEANNELVSDSAVTMLAKPANAQVVASIPPITPSGGTRIVSTTVNGIISYDTRKQTSLSSRVNGRIERLLIKYNYQPVRKGQLILEVYSPDHAAELRELIFVAGRSRELLPGA